MFWIRCSHVVFCFWVTCGQTVSSARQRECSSCVWSTKQPMLVATCRPTGSGTAPPGWLRLAPHSQLILHGKESFFFLPFRALSRPISLRVAAFSSRCAWARPRARTFWSAGRSTCAPHRWTRSPRPSWCCCRWAAFTKWERCSTGRNQELLVLCRETLLQLPLTSLCLLLSPRLSLEQHEAIRSHSPLHRSLSQVRGDGGKWHFKYPFGESITAHWELFHLVSAAAASGCVFWSCGTKKFFEKFTQHWWAL